MAASSGTRAVKLRRTRQGLAVAYDDTSSICEPWQCIISVSPVCALNSIIWEEDGLPTQLRLLR